MTTPWHRNFSFLRILLSHDTDIIFVSDTLKQDFDKFWLQIRCVHIKYLLMTTPWQSNYYFLKYMLSHTALTLYSLTHCVYEDVYRRNI